jgi:hypothetical protein
MAGMGPVGATAEGRHPGVTAAARWLDVNPGLPPELQAVAQVFTRAAMDLLDVVPRSRRCPRTGSALTRGNADGPGAARRAGRLRSHL